MADIQFEHIDPYIEGQGDTGLTARQKLKRNFDKIKAWMDNIASSLVGMFLRKDQADSTNFFVTFLRGIKFGVFTSGPLGTGGAVTIDQNGNSHAEFDYIEIRKTASFRSITILELKHIGGELGLTAGAMTVSKVEVYDDRYRCYFDTTDGKRQVYQEFIVGDQARCQTFQLAAGGNGMTRTKYYWRLVVGVGADFIELSRKDADTGSGEPGVDDNIIQLGYRGNGHPERQSAIILSAVANDAPSMKYYQGINSYNLTNNLVKDDGYDPSTGLFHTKTYGESYVGKSDQSTYMKFTPANGVEIKGKVEMSNASTLNGANLADTIGGLTEGVSSAQSDATAAQTAADIAGARIDALSSGAENLLRNSGFTGDYTSESVTSGTEVNAGTQMYSDAFDHWTKTNATAGTNASSASGVAVTLSNGSLTQTLERTIAAGTKCIFSFRGSGSTLTFSLGGYNKTITLANSVQLYQETFETSAAGSTFTITAVTGVIMELMLIEGTIPNGNWVNSPKDNDKTLAYFQALSFLTDAIENNNTDILGGLILTQLIKVGYMQNSVRQITGGMNGLANNDDSPFLWGGGTLDQAAATITAYANDPTYQPTPAELQSLAKFVVTHGGRAILNDIIMRGIVYATGGKFTGSNGMYGIEFDADSQTIKCKSPSEVTSPNGTTPVSGATEMVSFEIKSYQNNLPYPDGNGNLRYFPYRSLTLRNNTPYGEAYVVINPTGIHFVLPKPNNENVIVDLGIDTFRISPDVIPTDPTYLLPGTIYRDSNGFLKIVTS